MWIISEHSRKDGEAIISASVGSPFDPLVNSAAEYVVKKGLFLLIAAGNEAVDACTISPASTPLVFTVAASSISNVLATFSNYGTCVDIIAPGVNCRTAYLSNGYADGDGTSLATPYVAGWAAVVQGCMHFKAPEKLANYLIQHSLKGAIEGDLKGTPNNFINLNCPLYCL
ncbi:proteinase T-like protein [Leptotrombidium deliense]|uniref:Proteinase T-like protein n=1 Tax=Leptotrombidium deliense TaxID=299467 RepID=A0A443S3K1_9ACAR|nr:proteinase T-like protein [Leptotrombidium deliense]